MSIYTPLDVLPLCNGLPFTLTDAQAQALIDGVVSQIRAITGITLAPQTITEWQSGRWTESLRLLQYPVRSVTSVTVWPNGSANLNMGGQNLTPEDAPDPLLPGDKYFLRYDSVLPTGQRYSRSGLIVRKGIWPGLWERQRGRLGYRKVEGNANIAVVYEAGFPAGLVPAEFILIVAAGVRAAAMHLQSGGLLATSESLDGWSQSFTVGGAAPSATIQGMPGIIGSMIGMIAPYIRPRVL